VNSDFLFEYLYEPAPDAEERFAQAWDLILALILEDYENEEREKVDLESDPCSTPSE
jgi:hypothetical protein